MSKLEENHRLLRYLHKWSYDLPNSISNRVSFGSSQSRARNQTDSSDNGAFTVSISFGYMFTYVFTFFCGPS